MRRQIRPIGRISLAVGACLSAAALSFWGLGADQVFHHHAPVTSPGDGGGVATPDSSSWSLGTSGWTPGSGWGAGGGIASPDSSSWS